MGGHAKSRVGVFVPRPERRVADDATVPPHEVIARGTASPVVVTDGAWHIVALNPEAEELLGVDSREAEGRPCHEVLCGRDRYGNRYCHEQCAVGTMARRGEAVRPFELDLTSASGEVVRAACSVIVLSGARDHRIVHILTSIPQSGAGSGSSATAPVRTGAASASAAAGAMRFGLTARELEVLRLLTDGKTCQGIADALFISLPTVRNHVHNFLRKMQAHSQVEAVAIAHREGLI